MASSPPGFVAVFLLLVLPGLAAAQPLRNSPNAGNGNTNDVNKTNDSDVLALSTVFGQWNLNLTVGNPCRDGPWFEPPTTNVTIGCKCSDAECRITQLSITGNRRNDMVIPQALFNLTDLVSLNLSNNNLIGSIPAGVTNLSKLETWWMFDNYIDGPFPEFQKLTNLTDLRMYGMKLQGPIPKSLSDLTKLENLMLGDLEGNNSFDFIADWENLSTLSLRNCGLSQFTLPNLRNLKYLDLRSNNLSGQIQELFDRHQNSSYIYVGENNFSGPLDLNIDRSSRPLDVSYNRLVTLRNDPAAQKWPINYIGTSIPASGTIRSENLTILNCLLTEKCNGTNLTSLATSFAINCGGREMSYSDPTDPFPTVFSEDFSDLGGAGFYVNATSHWVISHVGSDPFGGPQGIVNASQDLGIDIPEFYRTARTSTSALWYYVVGLANRKYTVQLFFAEIVITDGSGRRLFDIDIQHQIIKKDFDIAKEAGGSSKPTNITLEVTVDNSVLVIHLYWSGRGTCCIPRQGTYGPLVSAIKVTPFQETKTSAPTPFPHSQRRDEKRRGVITGIATLCIAAAVISSSVVYLWWKWVSLVKRPVA